MRQAMIGVVAERHRHGRPQIPGFEVGGKTGTAQLGTDPARSHAWIIGFAGPAGRPAGRGGRRRARPARCQRSDRRRAGRARSRASVLEAALKQN